MAATLSVGPNAPYKTISAAAVAAQDGDTVEIAAGQYRGDVAVWTQSALTIRGLGSGAELIANGAHAEGKATWVIRNGNFDISNITFRGSRVPDQNGAGIRFEHGNLKIKNCRFFDNENGILVGNDGWSVLSITDSEFADAPRGTPLAHLLYVGRIERLEVTGSVFRNGWEGHLLKSRARINYVQYNRLYDGNEGGSSYEIDFPNGGLAVVTGNIIGQSPNTQNPRIIAYGSEGQYWPNNNALYLAHNTIVDDRPSGGIFVDIWRSNIPAGVDVVAQNNLLIGNGTFDLADDTRSGGNVLLGANAADAPKPPNFRLPAQTTLRARPFACAVVPGVEICPKYEFLPPVGTRKLLTTPPILPGAVQTPDLAFPPPPPISLPPPPISL
jgi:hypothetical protein